MIINFGCCCKTVIICPFSVSYFVFMVDLLTLFPIKRAMLKNLLYLEKETILVCKINGKK